MNAWFAGAAACGPAAIALGAWATQSDLGAAEPIVVISAIVLGVATLVLTAVGVLRVVSRPPRQLFVVTLREEPFAGRFAGRPAVIFRSVLVDASETMGLVFALSMPDRQFLGRVSFHELYKSQDYETRDQYMPLHATIPFPRRQGHLAFVHVDGSTVGPEHPWRLDITTGLGDREMSFAFTGLGAFMCHADGTVAAMAVGGILGRGALAPK